MLHSAEVGVLHTLDKAGTVQTAMRHGRPMRTAPCVSRGTCPAAAARPALLPGGGLGPAYDNPPIGRHL